MTVSSMTYRSFVIRVGSIKPETKQYDLRVEFGIPGGQPAFDEKETCQLGESAFEVDEGGIPVNLLEQLKGRNITPPQLYKLGAILSALIVPGTIRSRLLESLKTVRASKQGLRIRLNIEARELVPLPWEYLYLEGVGTQGQSELNFLALQPDISIVRHEVIVQREPRLERREKYRLVAALAEPGKPPQLDIEKDRKAIQQMLGKVKEIGTIEPVWVENATPDSLFNALREGADIFHFAGHGYFNGETGQLVLHGNDGRHPAYYDASSLAQLVTNKVQLAVLGACESAQTSGENIWGGVAQALVQAGVAAVVASQLRLADANAEPLAEEIYRGVLSGDTIDEAVSHARRAIRNKSGFENRDWGALVLYLRVEDGIIFPRQSTQATAVSFVPRIAPTPLQSPLIGRDDEITSIQPELLGGKYYFYGAYGVGKTSLVTTLFTSAVKDEAFTDGYLWYRVSQGVDASNVLEWIGAQFGEETVARTPGLNAKVNALRELLAPRNNLLIGLDDVYDAKVARAVLEAAGNCTVVLNGPKKLGLSDQSKEVGLAPLRPAEAASLFAVLINRPLKDVMGADRRAIEVICEKMGYLPLAIKLAALKHAEGESLKTIQARLDIAPATFIEGHEEVSTIFDAIYDDLQKVPAASRMLVHLASFPALEAPIEPLRTGEDDLEFFQAKDKLIALGVVSSAGMDRLAVHPLLGRLALNRAGRREALAGYNQVAEWLLNYAREHKDDYVALERERRNLLGAFDWFDIKQRGESTIKLLRDLFDYLRVRAYWQEALERLRQSLKFAQDLQRTSDEAWVYLHIAILLTQQGDYNLALENLKAADTLYAQDKNQTGRGQVLFRQANLNYLQGKLGEALRQARRSLSLMNGSIPARDRAGAHTRVASILATRGDLEGAREQYEQSLAISVDARDLEQQAMVHSSMGRLFRKAGKHQEALSEYQLAYEQYREIGHVKDMAMLELEIGYQHYYRGDYDKAASHFREGLTTFGLLKYKLGLALAHHALGNIAYSLADSDAGLEAASREYQTALEINRDSLKADLAAARNLYQLGVIAHRRGLAHEARTAYLSVEKVARREKDLALIAGTLHQLGRLDLAQGNHKQAASRANQALKIAQKAEDRLTEVSALCLVGLIETHQGELENAKEKLAIARDAFRNLNAPEALKVEQLLRDLEHQLDSSAHVAESNAPSAEMWTEPEEHTRDGGSNDGSRGIDVVQEGSATALEAEIIQDDASSTNGRDDGGTSYGGIDVITDGADPPVGGGSGGDW